MKKVEAGKMTGTGLLNGLGRVLSLFLFLSTTYYLPSAHAAVPAKITYQGNIRQNGNLVTGQRNIVFRIYPSSTSISELWTSPVYPVTISTGVFKVDLAPALSDWETGSLWLELDIEGTRLSPRDELTSTPYSINSLLHSGKRYSSSATPPVSPALGDLWMDTSANVFRYWNGTVWATGGTGSALGDNLGDHTATKNLIMTGFDITGAGYITASSAALSGQLIVYGTSTLTGMVGMGGALNVAGASTLTGDADLGGNLNVGTYATFGGSVTARSDLGVTGYTALTTMSVTGAATFAGSIYLTGVSSFTNVGNIYIAGGNDGQVLMKNGAGGPLKWSDVSAIVAGDNLGNHTATTALNMMTFNIVGVSTITVSSITTTAANVTFSTNVFITGNAGIGRAPVNSKFSVIGDDSQAYSLAVGTGTAYNMVVSTSGNMGIGTQNPQAKLDVSGGEASGEYIAIFKSGGKMAAWIMKE